MNVKASRKTFFGLVIIITCGCFLCFKFLLIKGHSDANNRIIHFFNVSRVDEIIKGFANKSTARYTSVPTSNPPITQVMTMTTSYDTSTVSTTSTSPSNTTKTTTFPPVPATTTHTSTIYTSTLLTTSDIRPSTERAAIVIPYRDRQEHLSLFMTEIKRFLRKQNILLYLFIIEQSSNGAFSRAKLLNIGFNESHAISNFSCYIFHDVDMLPMSPDNYYHCGDSPIHMAVGVEKYGFKLPHDTYAGGVLAMTGEQFLRINGFSNLYFGWGGEDDDVAISRFRFDEAYL